MLDVGGEGRKRHRRSNSESHRDGKQVYQFFTGVAHDMTTQDAVTHRVEDDIRPGDWFGAGP